MKLIHLLIILLTLSIIVLFGSMYINSEMYFGNSENIIYGTWTQKEYDEAVDAAIKYYKNIKLNLAIESYEYFPYDENSYKYLDENMSTYKTIMLRVNFSETSYSRYVILKQIAKGKWDVIEDGSI